MKYSAELSYCDLYMHRKCRTGSFIFRRRQQVWVAKKSDRYIHFCYVQNILITKSLLIFFCLERQQKTLFLKIFWWNTEERKKVKKNHTKQNKTKLKKKIIALRINKSKNFLNLSDFLVISYNSVQRPFISKDLLADISLNRCYKCV